MINVTAPDGATITFPDGTDHDTINQVMQQRAATIQSPARTFGEHAANSALFGTAPAIEGLTDVSPWDPTHPISNLTAGPLAGLLKLGIAKGASALGLTDGSTAQIAQQRYNEGREKALAILQAGDQQNPKSAVGGDIAGAIATLPLVPEISALKVPAALERTAPLAARAGNVATRVGARAGNAAATGAEIGGAQGLGSSISAGDDLSDIGLNTLKGAGIGAAVGGAASPVLEAATAPIAWAANRVKAARDPGSVAQSAVADLFEHPDIQRGTLDAGGEPFGMTGRTPSGNLTQAQPLRRAADIVAAANARGVPLTLADLGGDLSQGMARTAADTSPAAAHVLEQATGPRLKNEGDMLSSTIRDNVGSDPDATLMQQKLLAAAKEANRPAYEAAYKASPDNLDSDALARLNEAPAVQAAKRRALSGAKNRLIANGLDDQFGVVSGPRTGKYSLVTWDLTRQELDDMASSAYSAGRKGQGAALSKLSGQINAELDRLVPAYKTARQGAAGWFNAEDMLQAGRDSVMKSRMGNTEMQQGLAQANPFERELFKHGQASELLKSIGEIPQTERANVINKAWLSSPASRARLQMGQGTQGAKELEMTARLVDMMDQTRAAVSGGSKTARYAQSIGLGAGTGFAYGEGTGDWKGAFTAGLAGGLLKHGNKLIDQAVAEKIAQLLASGDPREIRAAAKMVSSSTNLTDAIRRTHAAFGRIAAGMATKEGLPQRSSPQLTDHNNNSQAPQ